MRSDDRFFDSAEKPPPPPQPPARLSSGGSARVPFATSPRDAPYPAAVPYAQQQQHHHQQQQQRSSRELYPDGYGYAQQQQQPPPPYQQQQQQQQQQHSLQYHPYGQYIPQHQQHHQQQQPLLPQTHSYHAPNGAFNMSVQAKPKRSSKTRVLVQMVKLAGFHALNAVLGFTAFSLLSTGVGSSVSLLPLCCVGIIVFRVVLYGVHVLAELDVMLSNFVSPPHEKLFLEVPLEPTAATDYVLAPSLEQFSPLSLMALLYFLSVKFGFAVLSAMSVSLTVVPVLVFLAAICGSAKTLDIEVGPTKFSYEHDSTAFLVAAACFSIIGCALMVFCAKASKRATRFFCCEPLARHTSRTPPQPLTVTANFSYGST